MFEMVLLSICDTKLNCKYVCTFSNQKLVTLKLLELGMLKLLTLSSLCLVQAAQLRCVSSRLEMRCWQWTATRWQKWATWTGSPPWRRLCRRGAWSWMFAAMAGTVSHLDAVHQSVCVRESEINHFKGCIPGVTALLTLLASLNTFDTWNWSVNYCEMIHEWSHDSQMVKDLSFFFFSCSLLHLMRVEYYCANHCCSTFLQYFLFFLFFHISFPLSLLFFFLFFLLPFLSFKCCSLSFCISQCGVFLVKN